MADTRVFSISDVIVTFDGVRLSGLADGDCVSATLTDDDTVMTSGCNGDSAIAFKNNNNCELTIKLLSTSPDNKIINDKVKTQLAARRGSFAIEVADGRGETILTMAQGHIKKRPDVSFATEVGSRDWVFHGRIDGWTVAGNELA